MAVTPKIQDSAADFSANYTGNAINSVNFMTMAVQVANIGGTTGTLTLEATIDPADQAHVDGGEKVPPSTAVWTPLDSKVLSASDSSHIFHVTVATSLYYRVVLNYTSGSDTAVISSLGKQYIRG